jgi:hypothetical protein
MKQKVLSYKQLPAKLPIGATILVYLLLDKFKPNDLIIGMVCTFMIIWWIGTIYVKLAKEESTEIKELK